MKTVWIILAMYAGVPVGYFTDPGVYAISKQYTTEALCWADAPKVSASIIKGDGVFAPASIGFPSGTVFACVRGMVKP